jgi:hypothetical protein
MEYIEMSKGNSSIGCMIARLVADAFLVDVEEDLIPID